MERWAIWKVPVSRYFPMMYRLLSKFFRSPMTAVSLRREKVGLGRYNNYDFQMAKTPK